jgi:hypothetical protein
MFLFLLIISHPNPIALFLALGDRNLALFLTLLSFLRIEDPELPLTTHITKEVSFFTFKILRYFTVHY